MSTLFLRFPDESAFRSLLPADFEQQGETGSPLPAGVTAISIIGLKYAAGTYDEQGNVITPPELVPGWHVNAEGVLPDAWLPYQIFPATPDRVFGQKTPNAS